MLTYESSEVIVNSNYMKNELQRLFGLPFDLFEDYTFNHKVESETGILKEECENILKTFFKELCEHHISGQLKVAPEHVSDKVLKLVRKSSHSVYKDFAEEYAKINKELGKKQFLVPYYIAGLPGAGLEEALEVALYLKKTGFVPDQVQDFYPTPGNLATCMYYTGLNPHE